jgi:hypothetical protein
MPRKSPAHDQRIITYRTLPDSSRQYQRVNVAECKAWVQTNLEFDLSISHTPKPRSVARSNASTSGCKPRSQTHRSGGPGGRLRPTLAATSRSPRSLEKAGAWSEKSSKTDGTPE